MARTSCYCFQCHFSCLRTGRLTVWVVVEIYHPDAHGSDSDLGLVPGGKVKLVKSASVDVSTSTARWEDRVSFTSEPAYVALFRGSHTPEHDHWSCAGRESLVFFLTWAALKVGGNWDLNCAWAYLKTQNKKKSNLLHVSSYQGANITRTKRWTHSWLNNAQNVAFLFYFNYIRLSPRIHIRTVLKRGSLGTKLLL